MRALGSEYLRSCSWSKLHCPKNDKILIHRHILSNISFVFVGNGVSRKNAFKIYWPLKKCRIWLKTLQMCSVLHLVSLCSDVTYGWVCWLLEFVIDELSKLTKIQKTTFEVIMCTKFGKSFFFFTSKNLKSKKENNKSLCP